MKGQEAKQARKHEESKNEEQYIKKQQDAMTERREE